MHDLPAPLPPFRADDYVRFADRKEGMTSGYWMVTTCRMCESDTGASYVALQNSRGWGSGGRADELELLYRPTP